MSSASRQGKSRPRNSHGFHSYSRGASPPPAPSNRQTASRSLSQSSLDALSRLQHVPQAEYDAQHQHGCMEDTRVNLLAELDAWAMDREALPIYWLAGMAGTGKSAVAWSFCDRLEAKGILGGSFFCSRTGLATRGDVKLIIPSLARLLAFKHNKFGTALIKQLDEYPDVVSKSIDRQIELLLQRPLSALASSRRPAMVLVIDALDECSDQEATADMLHALIALSSLLLPLKFFVTSRPERRIRETPLSDDSQTRVFKLHQIKPTVVDADISLYFRSRLSKMQRHGRAWYTDWEIEKLTKLSSGLFIYASTAVKYIDSRNSAQRLSRLTNFVGRPGELLTKPLDSMYEMILDEASSPQFLECDELASLKQILSFILSVRTSLSIRALGEFLRIPPEQLRGSLDLLHAVIYIPDSDSLPGLDTLHASFGDFLTERAPDHIRISRPAGHEEVLRECFRRMSNEDLCFNISKTPSSYYPHPNLEAVLAGIAESLEYASLHWAHHLSSVLTPSLFIPDIARVFCLKFLFWLELLSILGRVNEASSLILTAIISLKSPSGNISRFLRDANAFIVSSREAIELSTPHIYLSALSSTPSESLIFEAFNRRFKQLPLVQTYGTNRMTPALLLMKGHYGHVISVAFSPDGTRIASGSDDQTIRVWDAHTGAEVLPPLTGHNGCVFSVVFSPDGTRIASGSDDKTIRVWDAHMGIEAMPPLTGHDGCVLSVAFSADGTRIASGSDDKSIRVWDAHTGLEVLPLLMEYDSAVLSVAFSPDGTRIASGSFDETIWVLDVRTGAEVALTGHDDSVLSVAFSPDGARIVSGSEDQTVQVWDVHTGAEVMPPFMGHDGWVNSVVFSCDGMRIASGSDDNTIRVWDAHMGIEVMPPLTGHDGCVLSVAFSPDGARIVSGSDDKTIRVWDAHTSAEVLPPLTVHDGSMLSVVFSPDGTRIASGTLHKTIRVWDAHTGAEVLLPLKGHYGWVNSVAFSPDMTRIASGSQDRTIRVWDAHTGMEVLPPLTGHHGWVNSVTFSPDGACIASGSHDRTILVWDAHTGMEVLPPLTGHHGWVNSVAFSPDGMRIASGSSDKTIRVWDAHTGAQLLPPLTGHDGTVYSIVFSPDGTRIASGSVDKTIRVWDAHTGAKVLLPLTGHDDSVLSVAFSPDGARIVSGSDDKMIRVWDAHTGAEVLPPLTGHVDSVKSVAFSPDGTRIVSGSSDKTIRLWEMRLPSASHSPSRFYSLSKDRVWITDRSGGRVFWVPPEYRGCIQFSPCTLLIGKHRVVVDFTGCGSAHGTNWTECFLG